MWLCKVWRRFQRCRVEDLEGGLEVWRLGFVHVAGFQGFTDWRLKFGVWGVKTPLGLQAWNVGYQCQGFQAWSVGASRLDIFLN